MKKKNPQICQYSISIQPKYLDASEYIMWVNWSFIYFLIKMFKIVSSGIRRKGCLCPGCAAEQMNNYDGQRQP